MNYLIRGFCSIWTTLGHLEAFMVNTKFDMLSGPHWKRILWECSVCSLWIRPLGFSISTRHQVATNKLYAQPSHSFFFLNEYNLVILFLKSMLWNFLKTYLIHDIQKSPASRIVIIFWKMPSPTIWVSKATNRPWRHVWQAGHPNILLRGPGKLSRKTLIWNMGRHGWMQYLFSW